jgi:hypothetical protein
MTLYQFTKLANAYATYNYAASAKRNHTPAPINIKVDVKKEKSYAGKKVGDPSFTTAGNVPKSSKNAPTAKDTWSPWSRLRSFDHTVSGTGFGRPYWQYPNNPFQA